MKKLLLMLVVASLLLVACNRIKPEQDRFISAMTEATCAVFQSQDLSQEEVETATKAIFKKYDFNPEDDAAMQALQTKYENVKEVEDAVKKAFEDCAPQEFLDALKAFEDTSGTTEAPIEGPAIEGSAVDATPAEGTPVTPAEPATPAKPATPATDTPAPATPAPTPTY